MEEHPDENKDQEELVNDEESDVSGSEEDGEEGESDGSESEQSEAGEDGGSGVSSDESDGGSDKCAICLQKFHGQELGLPETCEHYFCLRCLTEWSKKVTTCPVDRKVFSSILVKGDVSGPVLRVVDVEVSNVDNPALFDEFYDTDPTYCEICGHCDREDRLLLCDNCDLGFHLECLEPPLEYVPIEDWYCPTCEAQRIAAVQEAGVSQPRATRRQLRLPRTGQSRRLIESIRHATRQTVTSTPETQSSGSTALRSQGTRRTGGRTKKKTYRKRSAKKAGRKRKRKTRKGKRRSRVATDRRPATTKGRLAVQLGIVPPRPGQVYVGLPTCRSAATRTGAESNCSALRSLRHQAGITPLRIFSTSEDLADYIEVDSDDDGPVGIARPHAVHRSAPVKPVLPATRVAHQNSPDVLGPILNNQMIMLTDRNIHVNRDGTLIPSLGNPMRNLNSCSPSSGIRNRPNGMEGSPESGARRAPGSPSNNDVNNHVTPGFINNNDASNRDANSYNKEPSSTSRRDSGSSWTSNAAANDPNGARAYEQFLQGSMPTDNEQSKTKPEESKSKNDEDEGTYSDIEDDASQDVKNSKNTPLVDHETGPPIVPDVSDNELVIDEEGRSTTHVPTTLPEPNAELNVDATENISLDDVPSPDSIPLPDSTPPASAIHDDRSDSDEDKETPNMQSSKSKSVREEYDPFQPLTSSDEEEHSAKHSAKRKQQLKIPASSTVTRRSVEEPEEIDLSSIPMPSDDYKKPAPEKIQFSIPTRHKLVSISSLIKRQKGVTKKETRTSNNFSMEISKAFGEEKQETDEEGEEPADGAPKLSLVAEIFGSDEEDEVQDQNTQQENSTSVVTENRTSEPEVTQAPEVEPTNETEPTGDEVGRWKTVQESTEAVPSNIQPDNTATIGSESDSDDSIAVVDTVQRTQADDDDIQFISISKPTKVAPNNEKVAKSKSVEKPRTSVLESISDGDSDLESKSDDSSKSSEDKDSARSKRRKISVLSGNAEEGEIVDSPDKRKKRKKEKKRGKKRRKSKEEKSRLQFTEKRPANPDAKTGGHDSSEEENQSESVSWKKPTHSAKERNYRDGKPKTEEKYFKSTPKKREISPKRAEKVKEPERERSTKEKPRSSLRGRSRSRSKSVSKDRGVHRRKSSRPRRSVSSTRSRGSRSRSRSDRRSRRRRRQSNSPRRSRSRSRSRGSPARRSRSPFRNRRRSASFNNSRRRKIRRRSNSSASTDSTRTGGKHRKGRKELRDRNKKAKEAEKTKEKTVEVKDTKDKEKEREKDKKKRKRRKEKSISPAKAIFADGDSIVVSLNFQKNVAATAAKDGSPTKNDSEGERKRNKRVRQTRTTSQTEGDGKPKFLKKTLLIDLETSPVQEQNIGVSPTLIVLSDDEDGEHKKGAKNDDGTTSNGPLDKIGRGESSFVKLPGINDGSLTQAANSSHDRHRSNGSLSPSESSNLTPVRPSNSSNNAGDQENGQVRNRTSRSLSHTPLKDDNMDIDSHSPAGSTPPLPSNTPPPFHSMGGRGNEGKTNVGVSQSSSSGMFQAKPVGSLSSLFGNSNLSSGGVPPPSMIPAPQVSQVRFPTGVNQFTTNLLATLYGPILAARQQQQGSSGSANSTSLNTRSNASNTNILLPKNQLAQSSHSRGKSTKQVAPGDSPFSPNSSDGDDLFEPPTDRANGDAGVRTDRQPSQSSTSTGAGMSGSSKPKVQSMFDSLFGNPSKKSTTPVKSHGKSSKGKGGGNLPKQKAKKHKKEVVKLTEGELRLTEDVPNSAVELRVKEKFLKKLNRQERVVEEVKLALKPHYSKKHVTKDEYKDILRRAVPKICHNKSGEINPSRIKELVEAYVKKIRHGRKKET